MARKRQLLPYEKERIRQYKAEGRSNKWIMMRFELSYEEFRDVLNRRPIRSRHRKTEEVEETPMIAKAKSDHIEALRAALEAATIEQLQREYYGH